MKGLKVAGIIAAIMLGVFLIVGMTIDGIVKSNIEESGRDLLKTEVEVEDIDISFFSGIAKMDGFIVHNPEGFSDEAAISLKEIEIELDMKSLFSETVVVHRIHVQNPEIFFEQIKTRVNLRELSTNINLDTSEDSEKSLIIKEIVLEEGKIQVQSELEKERTINASIDRIELTNIGESGSSTTQQAIKEIIEPVIKNAISKAVESGLLDKLDNTIKDLIDF